MNREQGVFLKNLFFVGELNQRLNASNKIILQLAEQLSVGDNYGYFFGVNDVEDIDRTHGAKIKIISKKRRSNPFARLEQFVNDGTTDGATDRKTAISRFTFKHPITAAKVAYGYKNPEYITKSKDNETAELLKEFINSNKIDAIITVQSAINVLALINDDSVAKIIYQLDPVGLHEHNTTDAKQLIDIELKSFAAADHIFTTRALYNQYKDNEQYMVYLDKMSIAEFANVRKITAGNQGIINLNEEYINIVYCGIMEDYYRSPLKFLLFMEKVFEKNNRIRIYFIGDIFSETLENFAKRNPENIIIQRPVDLETAIAIQSRADILLSIGNMIKNQLPSKLFDYFSMGKAVLTTLKYENSLEKRYMDKYPMGYMFYEYSDDNSVDEFISFADKSKSITVDFETVKELFYDCTPEYVANQFREKLSENKI